MCRIAILAFAALAAGKELSIVDFGADMGDRVGFVNTNALQAAFGNATAADLVVVPEGDWYMLGGITASNRTKLNFQLRGWIRAVPSLENWPKNANGDYATFIEFTDLSLNMTGPGGIDGQGEKWWDIWILDPPHESRPNLVNCLRCVNSYFAHFTMHNSPMYHLDCQDVKTVEIYNVTVQVDRAQMQTIKAKAKNRKFNAQVGMFEPEDLNTDGFDVSGTDVYIHDCTVHNDDDSIAVKPCNKGCTYTDCSTNMLFERNTLVGVGATIGSVPPHELVNCVRNITFRDIKMPGTAKGIYVKSNPTCGGNKTAIIQDVLYENIEITDPLWWPIWIGPQQQHEPGSKLGRKCALSYPLDPHCPTQGCATFKNIVLKDVYISNPVMSPGVLMGNETNPMEVTFHNVTVHDGPEGGKFPFGNEYECRHTHLQVSGGTWPIPLCAL
eukprot:TRINITY_DN8493_c0_g1_i1.p1 TRINITY_DN8493_c0_g1~~TRINITY_DN8493_c0_g1_i1.p1  ORF type:complete len:453 (+),score=154.26 TRINITY_DN8493_c0_g1_i1:39-1361(+)